MKSLLHIIKRASTCGTRVHIDIERFMIKTTLVDRFVVIHRNFKVAVKSFIECQSIRVLIVLQGIKHSGCPRASILCYDEQDNSDKYANDNCEYYDDETYDMLFWFLIFGWEI
jgi:hypothetical protein